MAATAGAAEAGVVGVGVLVGTGVAGGGVGAAGGGVGVTGTGVAGASVLTGAWVGAGVRTGAVVGAVVGAGVLLGTGVGVRQKVGLCPWERGRLGVGVGVAVEQVASAGGWTSVSVKLFREAPTALLVAPATADTANTTSSSAIPSAAITLVGSPASRRTVTPVMVASMGRQEDASNGTAVLAPNTAATERTAPDEW